MLFILGVVLVIGGIYLYTYTTVVMVNQPMNVMGQIYNIPQAEQIQPYLEIGILMILSAIIMIIVALLRALNE